MSDGYRLPRGGLIDRSRAVSFTFNGRTLQGYAGDTLASALIANGVNVIGRSFKYHRPRGFYGAGTEDPNSMLAVRDAYAYEPALRAGQVRLSDGLEAHTVRGWPSASFDLVAGVQLAARAMSAGFYYKTFKWPNWSWFEPLIRRSTGFGRPSGSQDTRRAHHRHASCDVLVIGGGPAGLSAARTLRGRGLSVILVDDQPQLGGSLNWESTSVEGQPGAEWARASATALAADSNVTVLTSTTATAAYEGNHFTLLQSSLNERGVGTECLWKVSTRHVVLATGMIDRPLLFSGNDRPGIMLSSSVRRLIGEFGVAPARRLAIYTNNDSGYLTALAAHRAGIEVAAIVDTRPAASATHAQEAQRASIPCLFDAEVVGTSGYKRLATVTVQGRNEGRRDIACTGLAVAGGFTPLIHLASHRGAKPIYDSARSAFVIGKPPHNWALAGGVAGTFDLAQALVEGQQAAAAIAEREGISIDPTPAPSAKASSVEAPSVEALSGGNVVPLWRPAHGDTSTMWVDFQNDVKASDVELAARENYVSVEHLKRYTTLGMGTDQGRTSNINGLALLAAATGRELGEVGTTTFRPPYTAIRMATIASERRGDLYRPRRLLPAHRVHEKLDAVFEDFGWERPDWYRSNGSNREGAVSVEMAAVRTHVGVFDGSSLGKIEIRGPDAAAFLKYFYVSNMATLKPGRIRYSVMLKDDGVIFDDGVVSCLGEHYYLASPTSGNAEAVAAWFERWRQTEWPGLKVSISTVTSHWASIAIAGPKARELLARLEPTFDISNEAFPHMQIREGQVGGVEARVARISFTGELQYEISVPARYASSLLSALLEARGDLHPKVVGLEAWLRLRLEKGYLHVGSETNGRTTPLDIGMAALVAKRTDDFIGKRSLTLPFATSIEREQLVGLMAVEGALEVGGRVLIKQDARPPCPTEGYVTSACVSPSLGKSIGLALLERGHSRSGETVSIYCRGRIVRARIVDPTFYDPTNARLQS